MLDARVSGLPEKIVGKLGSFFDARLDDGPEPIGIDIRPGRSQSRREIAI